MSDVTIIVTTYNRPAWLETSLYSILASAAVVRSDGIVTRVLLVDDGSPNPETRAIAERTGVDYLRLPTNVGTSAARMAGLATVDSPYFAFFDDDDFMLPRWFRLHLAAIAEYHDVVSSWYQRTDADLRPMSVVESAPVTFEDLLAGKVSANDGSLIRRSALEGITWHPEREHVMMMSLWLELASRGRLFRTITEPTFFHRRHGGNITDRLDGRDQAFRAQALAEYVVPA